jgi:hypothetical protein
MSGGTISSSVMSKANPPFQVEGPPYPTDLPFYQTEALSWLKNNKNKSALASDQFGNTPNAIEAVKKLYALGAVQVDVVVTHLGPSTIQREGGPYADTLEVTFPQKGRHKLLAFIRSLHPDNWEMNLGEREDPYTDHNSLGGATVPLWWD